MTEQRTMSFPDDQLRAVRLQTTNWGTFLGSLDIPISEKGFLFVGKSGSGKSTLVDAISQLLVPQKWLLYNAAAHEAGGRVKGDRTLVSYLRGAWGMLETNTMYHRPPSGQTATTVAGIALTMKSRSGRTVTLMQCFLVNSANEVKRVFAVAESDVELIEVVTAFGSERGELRAFKARFPKLKVWDQFNAYSVEFRRLLGIKDESALRLFLKAQSAKNVGSLDDFIRQYVLEEPTVFEKADDLITEFSALSNAYGAVVKAREQIDVLTPAEESLKKMKENEEKANRLDGLKQDVPAYGKMVQLSLFDDDINEAAGELAKAEEKERKLHGEEEALNEEIDGLTRSIAENGGGRLMELQKELARKEKERDAVLEGSRAFGDFCRLVKYTPPQNRERFDEILETARAEIDEYPKLREDLNNELGEINVAVHAAETKLNDLQNDIRRLEKQRSGIPWAFTAMRRHLASAAGLTEDDLPFAGEFIEVDPDESKWRGAIERWLRPFALTILVRPEHFDAVVNAAKSLNLGEELRFMKAAGATVEAGSDLPKDSVLGKIRVTETRWKPWIEDILRRDYAGLCLPVSLLGREPEVLTSEGLVRRNEIFEKDDRHGINDPKAWVLGVDVEAKLAVLHREEAEARKKLQTENIRKRTVTQKLEAAEIRHNTISRLIEYAWADIDPAPFLAEMKKLAELIRIEKQASDRLAELEYQKRIALDKRTTVRDELSSVRYEVGGCRTRLDGLKSERDDIRAGYGVRIANLSEANRKALAERFAAIGHMMTRASADEDIRIVLGAVDRELTAARNAAQNAKTAAERAFSVFCSRWEADAADLTPTVEYAEDFMTKLEELRADGLPRFEERFRDLLHRHALNNLSNLGASLKDEIASIKVRMEEVNKSLKRIPFSILSDGTPTYLSLRTNARHLPEYDSLLRDIAAALDHATDPNPDDETYEKRFRLLSKIVSSLQDDRGFRERALDVRRQMTFMGQEYFANGELYLSHPGGSGKSGGERLKLTTACLAAALRYQLCGDTDAEPVFPLVVVDEAFDKIDVDKAKLSLEMFSKFGFQMLLVTPGKLLTTIEPFIGGAFYTAVDKDHVSSGISLIYDEEAKKLDRAAMLRTLAGAAVSSGADSNANAGADAEPKDAADGGASSQADAQTELVDAALADAETENTAVSEDGSASEAPADAAAADGGCAVIESADESETAGI